ARVVYGRVGEECDQLLGAAEAPRRRQQDRQRVDPRLDIRAGRTAERRIADQIADIVGQLERESRGAPEASEQLGGSRIETSRCGAETSGELVQRAGLRTCPAGVGLR